MPGRAAGAGEQSREVRVREAVAVREVRGRRSEEQEKAWCRKGSRQQVRKKILFVDSAAIQAERQGRGSAEAEAGGRRREKERQCAVQCAERRRQRAAGTGWCAGGMQWRRCAGVRRGQ